MLAADEGARLPTDEDARLPTVTTSATHGVSVHGELALCTTEEASAARRKGQALPYRTRFLAFHAGGLAKAARGAAGDAASSPHTVAGSMRMMHYYADRAEWKVQARSARKKHRIRADEVRAAAAAAVAAVDAAVDAAAPASRGEGCDDEGLDFTVVSRCDSTVISTWHLRAASSAVRAAWMRAMLEGALLDAPPAPPAPPPPPGIPAPIAQLWRAARGVMFDVDSTLSRFEGIDELAAFLGQGPAVAALTAAAMGEGMPFRQALAQRLALVAPSRADLERFLAVHPPAAGLTAGAADLVGALTARGTVVFLVSGGFDAMIHPLADALGVPRARVFANRLLFTPAGTAGAAGGAFAGFDEDAPTSCSGGKLVVARRLREALGGGPLVCVGDGLTDMEARAEGGADCFIGFGGVRARPAVEAGADAFVTSFGELHALLL